MTSCNNHFVYTSTSQYPNPNQLYITRIFCKKVQNLAQFCYQNSKLSALIAGNGIWGVLVFKISRVGYPRTSLHSSYRLYFHARNIASRKYLIGRSYKNYGFDWPFLFADCIIAWHESITLALVCSCVHPPPNLEFFPTPLFQHGGELTYLSQNISRIRRDMKKR